MPKPLLRIWQASPNKFPGILLELQSDFWLLFWSWLQTQISTILKWPSRQITFPPASCAELLWSSSVCRHKPTYSIEAPVKRYFVCAVRGEEPFTPERWKWKQIKTTRELSSLCRPSQGTASVPLVPFSLTLGKSKRNISSFISRPQVEIIMNYECTFTMEIPISDWPYDFVIISLIHMNFYHLNPNWRVLWITSVWKIPQYKTYLCKA